MRIKEASFSDKEKILKFCKNTFSWGDYIENVWDYWILEGNFLVAHENNEPVAICHALITPQANQVWIEGIRVHPNFRLKGIAKQLVKKAEEIAQEKNCNVSYMLIDTTNLNSLKLAKTLNYKIIETWYFYSLSPRKTNSVTTIHLANYEQKLPSKLFSSNLSYVKSWRWFPLDSITKKELISKNQIIFKETQDSIALCILTESEHFDKTLLVTLINDSNVDVSDIFSQIQYFSYKNNHQRIQILTKQKSLPNYDGLENRLSFHLLKKEI